MTEPAHLHESVVEFISEIRRDARRRYLLISVVLVPAAALLIFVAGDGPSIDDIGFICCGVAILLIAAFCLALGPWGLPRSIQGLRYVEERGSVEYSIKRWATLGFSLSLLLLGCFPPIAALTDSELASDGRFGFFLLTSPFLVVVGAGFALSYGKTRITPGAVHTSGRILGWPVGAVVTEIESVELAGAQGDLHVQLFVKGAVRRKRLRRSASESVKPVAVSVYWRDGDMLDGLEKIQRLLGVPIRLRKWTD